MAFTLKLHNKKTQNTELTKLNDVNSLIEQHSLSSLANVKENFRIVILVNIT